jgi:hypothetical protein
MLLGPNFGSWLVHTGTRPSELGPGRKLTWAFEGLSFCRILSALSQEMSCDGVVMVTAPF